MTQSLTVNPVLYIDILCLKSEVVLVFVVYLYISEKFSSSLTFIVTVYAHVYRFYVQKSVSASDTQTRVACG
jgi:hypothetical protein